MGGGHDGNAAPDVESAEDAGGGVETPGEIAGVSPLDRAEKQVADPHGAKKGEFTWSDMVDFANFAINHEKLSDGQKSLLHGLAAIRQDADAADLASALMRVRGRERAEALTMLLPLIDKAVQGTIGIMEGVTLASGVADASDETRNGIVRVVNDCLELFGGKAFRWTRNNDVSSLVDRVVAALPEFAGHEEVLSLVRAPGEMLTMWPGDRRED